MTRLFPLLVLATVLFSVGMVWAEEEEDKTFSAELRVEAGTYQFPGSALTPYQFSRLKVESQQDLLEGLSYGFEGAAFWQTSSVALPPPETQFPVNNVLNLEYDQGDTNFYSFELDRAFLRFTSGPLDVSAGLWKPQWGSSYFYKPTDYFFPNQPLQWLDDTVGASEGLDASYFLFDDLSVEGTARVLEGGATEGVVRLEEKGIGLTVTPSAAWMTGRNAFGLELVGTLPTLQIRLEGSDWLYADQHTAANWIMGFSTTHEGVKYTAEILRDGTGDILGAFSDVTRQATYAFMSAEGSFFTQWKAAPALVVPLEGGPFLFWPKVEWAFAPQWNLGFQGQVLLGNWKGPLDLYPGRAEVSVAYSF